MDSRSAAAASDQRRHFKPVHPSHARIHLIFLKKFTALDLIDPDLHLCVKPALIRNHAIHRLRQQLLLAAPGAGSQTG
jgi:hypothetical protein